MVSFSPVPRRHEIRRGILSELVVLSPNGLQASIVCGALAGRERRAIFASAMGERGAWVIRECAAEIIGVALDRHEMALAQLLRQWLAAVAARVRAGACADEEIAQVRAALDHWGRPGGTDLDGDPPDEPFVRAHVAVVAKGVAQ